MDNLVYLVFIPILGAILSWLCERVKPQSGRWLAIGTMALMLGWLAGVMEPSQTYQMSWQWFSRFNIHFSMYLDGLSYILIVLTLALGILCVAVSWKEIQTKVGFFHFNLLLTIAGINGVFLASDLFMLFFFWEVMLIPMTALIAIWGHENRRYAAIKFFIFTQASSLLMLISIIALALIAKSQTGTFVFNMTKLAQLDLPAQTEFWIMLGFFVAFAVKLPSFPIHTWLPDAHTQAPTAGSVLLAGILLKTGAYGFLRILMPLFPDAMVQFANIAVTLGVISVLYGAKMAFAQTDFKRLVAYSSISHMGFITLALFSGHQIAVDGAILIMIAHGLSSSALFSMAGLIQHRIHTRELNSMGGMWTTAPVMGASVLFFVAAAVGLPGLANFVGEFMSLLGSFQRFPIMACLAALGLIGSAIYGLKLFQTAFQGIQHQQIEDLDKREMAFCGCLALALIVLGLFPDIVLLWTNDLVQSLAMQSTPSGQLIAGGL